MEPKELTIILLIGKKESGKSTLAKSIQFNLKNKGVIAPIFSYAFPLKELLNGYYKEDIYIEKGIYRGAMQTMGDAIRGWDRNFFVKKMISKINSELYSDSTTIIIDDLRYFNEFGELYLYYQYSYKPDINLTIKIVHCVKENDTNVDPHSSESGIDEVLNDIRTILKSNDSIEIEEYRWAQV